MSHDRRIPAAAAVLATCIVTSFSNAQDEADQVYDQVAQAVIDLLSGEEDVRIAAAGKLAGFRAVYSVPALDKALADESALVRAGVVKALGGIAHKSSAKALVKAVTDPDPTVATLAATALGDMHTTDSYDALLKALGKVKDPAVKAAVLEGVKKWNKPFTPLPPPVELPEGKDVPPMPAPPEPEPAPVEEIVEESGPGPGEAMAAPAEGGPGKVGIKAIASLPSGTPPVAKAGKPPEAQPPADLDADLQAAAAEAMAGALAEVIECIESAGIEPPFVPVKVSVTPGGHMSQMTVLRMLDPEPTICVHDAIEGVEFPPASASYGIEYMFEKTAGHDSTADAPETGALPGVMVAMAEAPTLAKLEASRLPLPLEMWDLSPSSSIALQIAAASLGKVSGKMAMLQIRGEWAWKFLGIGAVIPFSGASARYSIDGEERNAESWIMGNVGLWARHMGSRTVGGVTLRWGVSLELDLPTSTKVSWADDPDAPDPDLFPATSSFLGNYYHHGLSYPDLEGTFKIAVRPDVDFAIMVGPLSFQLEMGFDAIVLGDSVDPEDVWGGRKDNPDVALFHLGFGAQARPLSWLQISLELTSSFPISGTSLRTLRFDESVLGDPAGGEAFATPGIAVILPAGKAGSGFVSIALRIPMGEIGSSAGLVRVAPMVLMATGFRFD